MIKNLLLVGIGSFIGGSLRYLVSQFVKFPGVGSFPLSTFIVNILGCFLIGFISTLSSESIEISPATRLLLTTGVCGGFTTFSTFMNETVLLQGSGHNLLSIAYLALSIITGAFALLIGRQLGLH